MQDIDYFCKHIPTLETERLILREMVPADADDIKRYSADERLYTYWGRNMSRKEKEPSEMFRPVSSRKEKDPDCICWGIELKANHRIIGEINLFDIQNSRMGEIGYRLNMAYHSKGYCTEGVRRVVQFAFEETTLQRIELRAMASNEASNRVALKCGFIKEGTIRQGKFVHIYATYNLYGLLKSDLYPDEGRNE